jgi:hypothetical protein
VFSHAGSLELPRGKHTHIYDIKIFSKQTFKSTETQTFNKNTSVPSLYPQAKTPNTPAQPAQSVTVLWEFSSYLLCRLTPPVSQWGRSKKRGEHKCTRPLLNMLHGLCCSKAFWLLIYEHTDCSILNDGFAYRLVVKHKAGFVMRWGNYTNMLLMNKGLDSLSRYLLICVYCFILLHCCS